MAYTNTIDPTDPPTTAKVSGGAVEFQVLKAALIERVESFFVDIDADPWTAHPIYVTGGIVITSMPCLLGEQTWNGAGVFAGIYLNITDTASAAGSALLALAISTVLKFTVYKDGKTVATRFVAGASVTGSVAYLDGGDGTAFEPTWGFNSSLVLGLNSAVTVPVNDTMYLHAHLLTKVTAAKAGTVQGLETWTWASHTSGVVGGLFGLIGNTAVSGVGGTTTSVICITGGCIVSGGTVTSLRHLGAGGSTIDGASSVVTTSYGLRIFNVTVQNSGSLVNQYGILIDNLTAGGTLNYAIKTGTGLVQFGDQLLLAAGTTSRSSLNLASGVAPTVPVAGDIWYDGTNSVLYTGLRVHGVLGYHTGVGGTVIQSTNKSTGVTLDKPCGRITLNSASLSGGAKVSFTFTNANIASTDTIQWGVQSGATSGAYAIYTTATTDGSCEVTVMNMTGSPLSEAVILNFTVLKGVNA